MFTIHWGMANLNATPSQVCHIRNSNLLSLYHKQSGLFQAMCLPRLTLAKTLIISACVLEGLAKTAQCIRKKGRKAYGLQTNPFTWVSMHGSQEYWIPADWVSYIGPARTMMPSLLESLQKFRLLGLLPKQCGLRGQPHVRSMASDNIHCTAGSFKVASPYLQSMMHRQQLLLTYSVPCFSWGHLPTFKCNGPTILLGNFSNAKSRRITDDMKCFIRWRKRKGQRRSFDECFIQRGKRTLIPSIP